MRVGRDGDSVCATQGELVGGGEQESILPLNLDSNLWLNFTDNNHAHACTVHCVIIQCRVHISLIV